MRPLVIYHNNCQDGFAAAWVARRALGECDFHAASYGAPPPDVADRDVLIVDFSYPREQLLALKSAAKSLRVLDHHKTAQEALAGLDFCVFDMERSGVGLTWDYLLGKDREHWISSPKLDRPWIVNYVEDRDLWRFKLADSKAVNAYLSTLEHDFALWDRIHNFVTLHKAAECGESVQAYIDQMTRKAVEHARVVTFCGHDVLAISWGYVNTSEIVGALAEKSPSGWALGYFQRKDRQWQYSLRSHGDFDVSEIAKRFGGGGHRAAAGFTATGPIDELIKETM